MLPKLPSKSVRPLLHKDCWVSREVMRANTTRCWSPYRHVAGPRKTTEQVFPKSFAGNVARLLTEPSNLPNCSVRNVETGDQNAKLSSNVCALAWTNHQFLTISRKERALCLTSLTLVSLILIALKRMWLKHSFGLLTSVSNLLVSSANDVSQGKTGCVALATIRLLGISCEKATRKLCRSSHVNSLVSGKEQLCGHSKCLLWKTMRKVSSVHDDCSSNTSGGYIECAVPWWPPGWCVRLSYYR